MGAVAYEGNKADGQEKPAVKEQVVPAGRVFGGSGGVNRNHPDIKGGHGGGYGTQGTEKKVTEFDLSGAQ